jgi:hypothetical protein
MHIFHLSYVFILFDAREVKDVNFSISPHENTQSNRVCNFQVIWLFSLFRLIHLTTVLYLSKHSNIMIE